MEVWRMEVGIVPLRTCLADGYVAETQWAKCRTVPKRWNYRGSEEAVLHEIHEVTGRRQSAKQVLNL